MVWTALIAMVGAILGQHLGLFEAISRIVFKISKCPKCSTFWVCLAILLFSGDNPINAMSLPTWERGLKLPKWFSTSRHHLVAPHVGAWIETHRRAVSQGLDKSLPTWERGLKHPGDRIAQLVFSPVVQAIFEPVESIEPTVRGSRGFGSTGLK